MLEASLVNQGVFFQNLLDFNGIHQIKKTRGDLWIVMMIGLDLLVIRRGRNVRLFLYIWWS